MINRFREGISGERTRLACGRKRPVCSNFVFSKGCFGESPKPARESRALPRYGTRIALAVLLIAFLPSLRAETIPPRPERYFNDYANIIPAATASRLNEQLAQFERETSDQVVVAVYRKMESDSSVDDYTQRVAQAWQVGQKEKRNGAVLFVFVDDRKMFIQVGYGLEGALPDATAFDITERQIKPRFRNNDYEGGLVTGVDLICKAIKGEYKGKGKTAREGKTTSSGGGGGLLIFLFVLFVFLLMIRASRRRGGYRYTGWGGPFVTGGWGGSGGGWSSGGGGGGGFSGFSGGGGSFGGGGAGSSW